MRVEINVDEVVQRLNQIITNQEVILERLEHLEWIISVRETPKQLPRLLRIKDVCQTVGLSRSTIYNRTNEGSFPQPIKIGAGSVAWKVEDIENWISSRPE